MNTTQLNTLITDDLVEEAKRHRHHVECMYCDFESTPPERAEYSSDIYKGVRRSALVRGVEARRGTDPMRSSGYYSAGFVLEHAAEKFFSLVEATETELRGRFTAREFDYILNSECSSVWFSGFHVPVAEMVADTFGVESSEDPSDAEELRVLVEKLKALTRLENAVLTDVCERVWRGYDNPLL